MECPNIKIGLKHKMLYIELTSAFFLAGFGSLMASNYKPYGV